MIAKTYDVTIGFMTQKLLYSEKYTVSALTAQVAIAKAAIKFNSKWPGVGIISVLSTEKPVKVILISKEPT